MTLPLYLAMTAAEISANEVLPKHLAYMACHFSPYSTGLSNFPEDIPSGVMVILNDRIPVYGHDPKLIAAQLQELCDAVEASCLLLDLQRPNDSITLGIIAEILAEVDCPVGISESYASDFSVPVFLSAPPLHQTLSDWVKPWCGREIWLESAPDSCTWTVTETGSSYSHGATANCEHHCPEFCCHYSILKKDNCVQISLERNLQDINALLEDAESLGITKAIGLFQQLGRS